MGLSRIYLSPPDVTDRERDLLLAAFDSGWVAPVGPDIDAFEQELSDLADGISVAALTSGTAALHLALLLLGVGPGDEVLVSTLTFAASANAVTYVGATPCFIDADEVTWNMDPSLLADELAERAAAAALPAAVLITDLYGQCADYEAVEALCAQYEVPLIEDAAEAVGATYRGRAAGTFGACAAYSFNGNKILTTAGGGALLSADPDLVDQARYLATQARQPELHYEHTDVGFNYRISNLLAALGRGQLERLPAIIERRRAINAFYKDRFGEAVGFMPVGSHSQPNWWLTVVTLDGKSPKEVCDALESQDIEARPAWKPLHMQPVFESLPVRHRGVAERVYASGVCLPSGGSMSDADVERVAEAFLGALT